MSSYSITTGDSDAPANPRSFKHDEEKGIAFIKEWQYRAHNLWDGVTMGPREREWFSYNTGKEMLRLSNVDSHDLHAALMSPHMHTYPNVKNVGFLLSASYAVSAERMIEYPVEDLELEGVGYHLPKGKTLVLRGNTETAGQWSEGTVINLSHTYDLGHAAKGLIINLGDVVLNLGNAAKGVVVNAGTLGKILSKSSEIKFGRSWNNIFVTKGDKFLTDGDKMRVENWPFVWEKGVSARRQASELLHARIPLTLHDAVETYVDGLVACARDTPELLKEEYGGPTRVWYALQRRLLVGL
jgi:hypothetical protein